MTSGSPADQGPAPSVTVEVRDCVAWVTLNRPRSLNALTVGLGRELLAIFGRVADDRDVRAVVLAASGRAFCAGIDLKELAGDSREPVREVLGEIFHPLILAIRTLDKPVISAVNGIAFGLGASLALAADVVICAESATFHVAFANIGLGVDGGTSALLTARVGFTRATQLALMTQPIGAQQALDWGLVNATAPDGELVDAVTAAARQLTSGSAGALAAVKRALNAAAFPDLEQTLELEAELQQQRAGSDDVAEAVRAFREKRVPHFN